MRTRRSSSGCGRRRLKRWPSAKSSAGGCSPSSTPAGGRPRPGGGGGGPPPARGGGGRPPAGVKRAEAELLVPPYDRQPVLFRRGRGCYLWDAAGRRYLDFLSGIGVNALGHGHPARRRPLAAQAGRLLHVSNLFYHDYQAALARRLAKISGLDRVFFTNSG